MNAALIIARGVHLATCLVVFGVDAFTIMILPAAGDYFSDPAATRSWRYWRRVWLWSVLSLLVISGAAWFILVTVDMTDLPLTGAGLRLVWSRSHFGRLWQLRSCFAAATIVLYLFGGAERLRLIRTGFSAALLASIAWSGHGQLSAWPTVHVTSDAIHLVVAGIWPTGLVPLALILTDRSLSASNLLRTLVRFSRISVVCVLILVVTGSVNTVLTLERFEDLVHTLYGWVLIGKIAAVVLMIGLGAMNRRAIRSAERTMIRERVLLEIGLLIVVITGTASLGMLAP